MGRDSGWGFIFFSTLREIGRRREGGRHGRVGREARAEEAFIYWLVRLYLEKEEKIEQLYSLLHFRKGRKEGRNGGRRSLRGAIEKRVREEWKGFIINSIKAQEKSKKEKERAKVQERGSHVGKRKEVGHVLERKKQRRKKRSTRHREWWCGARVCCLLFFFQSIKKQYNTMWFITIVLHLRHTHHFSTLACTYTSNVTHTSCFRARQAFLGEGMREETDMDDACVLTFAFLVA